MGATTAMAIASIRMHGITATGTANTGHTSAKRIAGIDTEAITAGTPSDALIATTAIGITVGIIGVRSLAPMPTATGIKRVSLPTGRPDWDSVFLPLMDAEPTGDGRVEAALSLDNFLRTVQHKAYQIAYGALWDRESALDVVQESLLRFVDYYRHKPASDWPALFRSVLNSRINDQRRKRLLARGGRRLLSLTGLTFGAPADDADEEAELPASVDGRPARNPEHEAANGELQRLIERAVGSLPQRQRQVFLLREQLGLSIQETADTLGCSANSIKQHHFRALRALRGQLAEVWQHERL